MEIQEHKKGRMQAVKIFINKHLYYIFLMLFVMSCKTSQNHLQHSYNKSRYTIKFTNNTTNSFVKIDSIDVIVNIHNKEQRTLPSIVTYGCLSIPIQNNKSSFKVKKVSVPEQIKVTSIGYFSIETEPFINLKYDKIILDLYLAEDDRPLTHCDGIN
ncbi:hypothetical protein JM658_01205 [Joostella atrarenae]|uniref:Late embryogenesis abundant protein LEA-2 subgroup domain-containing protein n=1 Tax=Joostella atrarenae TaxID=679257 RepID=A0ABS9IZ33_9FLAO|nr:hypothetical protein [Joostella atrarenae]MCF8713432.1 hypothetical protein [Joostella atrarenae]